MNRRLYSFLLRKFCVQDSPIGFTQLLKENDIKDFIESTYGITINSVVRDFENKSDKIKFRFTGIYLHAGFNNIVFEGTFLANDFIYEIQAAVFQMSVNYSNEWKKFMIRKFGNKYIRKLKKQNKN